jgi:hypothetical protein
MIDIKKLLEKHVVYSKREEYFSSLWLKEFTKELVDVVIENCEKVITESTKDNCNDHTPYWGACCTCGRMENYDVLDTPDNVKESIKDIKEQITYL